MSYSGLSSRIVALAVLYSLFVPPAAAGDSSRYRWNELAPLIDGKKVWLPLKDGARVVGIVRGVESAGIRLEVTKTSDRKAYPKGLTSVPRLAITTIQVNKPSGHKGLIIGGAVGGGIAATIGGILAAIQRNEGGTSGDAIVAVAILAPVAIGLLVGWAADSAAHHGGFQITVIPD